MGLLTDPACFRAANGWLALGWTLAAVPVALFLRDSVAFVVLISVYAVVMGHVATWQAARVEERQAEAEDRQTAVVAAVLERDPS